MADGRKILLQQGARHGIVTVPLSDLTSPCSAPFYMPTYDYECQKCGHLFEAKQSMKDPHLTDCPQEACPGPIKRKIGAGAGFIFKGNGFYITDYRSDSYKAAAKKDSESASSSSTASATPAPAAPAAASPAPAKTGTAA